MGSWYLSLKAFAKGPPQDVENMRKRLSAIMENRDKLNDAGWLRGLFGQELAEIEDIGDDLSDDDAVVNALEGLDYDWSDGADAGSMEFGASSVRDLSAPERFSNALSSCFPRVEFYKIAAGEYLNAGYHTVFPDGDFDESREWDGVFGGRVLGAYISWEYACAEKWLLPGDAPAGARRKARQKADGALMVFEALEYAHGNFDEGDEALVVSGEITEAALSVIYEHLGDGIEKIIFDGERQPGLPENVSEAARNGGVVLENYRGEVRKPPAKKTAARQRLAAAGKPLAVAKPTASKKPATIKNAGAEKPAAKKAANKPSAEKKSLLAGKPVDGEKAVAKKAVVAKKAPKAAAPKKIMAKDAAGKAAKATAKKPSAAKKPVAADKKPAPAKKPAAAKKSTAEEKLAVSKKAVKKPVAKKKA